MLRSTANRIPNYQHEKIGFNYRMSDICAGIGRGHMTIVNDHIAHHKHVQIMYEDMLKDVPLLNSNGMRGVGNGYICILFIIFMRKANKIQPLTGGLLEQLVLDKSDWGSKSTQQSYESLIKQMRAYANGGFETRVVDDQYCQELADFMAGRLKPSSVRNYLERLKTLFNIVMKNGMVGDIPNIDLSLLMPKREGAEKVFLTKEELRRMEYAECPAESTKNAFLFSCYTGLLKGEVQELKWDAIRLNGTGMVLTRPIENSDEKAKVPIVGPARVILQNAEKEYSTLPHEQQDDRVFHLFSNITINDHIKKWAKSAGINKHINYMTSRHTFATMALRAGVDLYVLAKWCGYSSVSSAEVYIDLVDRGTRSNSEMLEAAFA